MKNAMFLKMIMLLIISTAAASAGVQADLKDQRFPADTKAYPGDIIRPQICPTDSNWVSFMIVVGFRTQLYITNTATLDERRITPRSDQDLEDDVVVQQVNDRDLAWRPVKSEDGKIWYILHKATAKDGKINEISFDPVEVQYLRVYGMKRATDWGYSLYVVKVFSSSGAPIPISGFEKIINFFATGTI